MWSAMEHFDPSVFLKDNNEGIARVKRDHRLFAFLMESATIDYHTQKECDLTKVGGKLDSKAYGIGMPMSMLLFFYIILICFFFFINWISFNTHSIRFTIS